LEKRDIDMEKRIFEISYDSNMITIGNIYDLSIKDNTEKLKELNDYLHGNEFLDYD
jgi:hypothetical protein